MDGKHGLREFLDAHSATGDAWTHTSLAGGKYFIGEDELPKLYELYVESCLDNEKLFLTEKSSEIGPLRIDFDFIYEPDVKKHLHTQDEVVAFTQAYMDQMRQYLALPPEVDIYVMQKRRPTLDTKKNRIKSGIHMVVPEVCTHKFVEQRVRRELVKRMSEFFPNLPLIESWDKVYDESVVNRTVPWTMYGSRKHDANALPYMIAYVLRYVEGSVRVVEDAVPSITVDLMKKMSLCRDKSAETPMTDVAQEMYNAVKKDADPRLSGGSAVMKRRGRLAQRNEHPGSRASSPDGRMLVKPLTAEEREYIKAHVLNLNPERADHYNVSGAEDDKFAERGWVHVGQLLYNIHPELLDVFLDFSAQSDKYDERGCIDQWNRYKYRNDGERMGIGSLRMWSREDSAMRGDTRYQEIEDGNIQRLVETALSSTEHDVAMVVHAKYRDDYRCCDFGKNVWFRWIGHIWRETDRGIDLQLRLSKEIAKVFFDKMRAIENDMSNRDLMECSGEDKKDRDCVCEHCEMERLRMKYSAVYLKLKTTKFKDNLMKECRELFFDEEFTKRLDSNKDLIAFNNGVLDLTTFEFRNGKPDDYMSFSTGIDYDPEREYSSYPAWPAVERFICQVLPDPEVRDYFIKHLATNLFGGNPAQKFHILTGSGSNGKSMIMNLMSTAVGDYACTVPISLFTQKRKGSGNAAPEVIRLKGRRFVTMQEPDEQFPLNTGLMKEITSGEKMYARDLFKSGTEFEVLAKFHLACNDKPKVNTTDGGTWRRLVVINFVSKFVPVPIAKNEFPLDESIQFAVLSKEWATPFVAYLVDVLRQGRGLRKLIAPSKVMEYTSEYRNENDAIAKFISEKTVALSEDDEDVFGVTKDAIRKCFKAWKSENDQPMVQWAELEKRIVAQYGGYPKGGWKTFRMTED